MGKGYKGYQDKTLKTKQIIKNIKDEHPQMQKAAYEAKYASQQLEKLYNQLYDMVNSLNDIVCGLVDNLVEKGTISNKSLDHHIESYVKRKIKEVEDLKVKSLGYGETGEVVEKDSLVLVNLHVFQNNEIVKSYPQKMYLMMGKTYLYPGLEGMVEEMKVGDTKKFDLIMPENIPVKEIRGVNLSFKVEVLDIRKKSKE